MKITLKGDVREFEAPKTALEIEIKVSILQNYFYNTPDIL